MKLQKINESFSVLISENSGDDSKLQQIHETLKAQKPDAKYNFKVQRGWESPWHYFCQVSKSNNITALKIFNGHLEIIKNIIPEFNISLEQEFSDEYIQSEINEIKKLMPFEPYDFQEKCAFESIKYQRQISLSATGSGKSLIIFLIIYFFYRNNKRGYLIVPNINLLQQLYNDFKDYFKDTDLANDFLSNIDIQGGGNKAEFNSFLVISTWQSLMNMREVLDKSDFILCDETHSYSAEVSSSIIEESINAKYKLGLTGTLPEDDLSKLTLLGLFGLPKRYIRASELIERGLGTPIEVTTIINKYNSNCKSLFNSLPKGQYIKQLKFIQELPERNKLIVDLACNIKKTGNTLVLGQHIEHMKGLFIDIMKKLYPDVEVQNKDISGKKSFEFQEKYGIYYIDGSDDAKTRELTRKILEEHQDAILISGYSLLSTGVNIRRLFNMIFASPMKSYTTITQSIGRGIRLHPDKKVFKVFDIVDDFGIKKPSGIFWKQYEHRKSMSYNSEGLPITERDFILN